MVHQDLGRMIVDTSGRIVLVLIGGWWGGLRRIDRTCGRAVEPLMGGLSLVSMSHRSHGEGKMEKNRWRGVDGEKSRTHPLDSKQT